MDGVRNPIRVLTILFYWYTFLKAAKQSWARTGLPDLSQWSRGNAAVWNFSSAVQTEAPPLGVARFFFLQAAAWPRCARFQLPSTRSNCYSGCMASCPIFLGPVGSFFCGDGGGLCGFKGCKMARSKSILYVALVLQSVQEKSWKDQPVGATPWEQQSVVYREGRLPRWLWVPVLAVGRGFQSMWMPWLQSNSTLNPSPVWVFLEFERVR